PATPVPPRRRLPVRSHRCEKDAFASWSIAHKNVSLHKAATGPIWSGATHQPKHSETRVSMRGRVLTAMGVLATLSVISVPAQQLAPAPKIPRVPANLLPGTKLSAFASVQGVVLSARSKVLPFRTVQLRDARTGRIVRTLLTDEE